MKKAILILGVLWSVSLKSQVLLTENFDNIPLLASQGWTNVNASEPVGISTWGGGVPFPAYNGASNSYAAVNHQSTGDIGTISNWLITPTVNLNNGDIISFFSRTHHGTWADRLELRISPNGDNSTLPSTSSASLGDFTILALTINPNLLANGYPTTWTNYTYSIDGLSQPTNCRIAFRYYVTNGGASAPNSDYIGVDALSVTSTLGINNFSNNLISLTPNPVQNILRIKTPETIKEVSVYSLLGKKVISTQISADTVDVSILTQGMYLLKVVDQNNKVFSSKFIKE
ncbi:choice-of-anchor J domain-containing protein [Flavobacterium sp.]|uniref:T9SS-dependent choice-of-anchor J family protein n=1 Tax=Flavobacterium sp. TaxID=239 RepID=UPI002638F68C|nr:choice-of-anchor J domain-containing protein [Flavobacterium sp.]